MNNRKSLSLAFMSPDGAYLLWRGVTPADGQSEPERNSEVFIANRDGSKPRNITNHEAFDGYPAWLPGDEGAIFASNRGFPGIGTIGPACERMSSALRS